MAEDGQSIYCNIIYNFRNKHAYSAAKNKGDFSCNCFVTTIVDHRFEIDRFVKFNRNLVL